MDGWRVRVKVSSLGVYVYIYLLCVYGGGCEEDFGVQVWGIEVLIVVGGLTVLTVGRYMEEWNSDCIGVGWEVLIGSQAGSNYISTVSFHLCFGQDFLIPLNIVQYDMLI